MAQKLFGTTTKARFSTPKNSGNKIPSPQKKTPGRISRLRPLKILLVCLLVLEGLYCLAVFSSIGWIKDLRTRYIRTAMSTGNHQWLATAFIPQDIVDVAMEPLQQAMSNQDGYNSTWTDVEKQTESAEPADPISGAEMPSVPQETEDSLDPAQIAFFECFHELDQASMLAYTENNPDVISDGWEHISINEAGLDDNGTSIRTTAGDKVLAIDAENQILLVRVTGSTYRGVLAIAKDPQRLSLAVSSRIGERGEHIGKIATDNGALLAISASGFYGPNGGGNGGIVTGACMSNGKSYGTHYWQSGYKRIELREDHRLYIVDAHSSFHEDATDAAEFRPALIIDGENALGSDNFFTELNPRACIGQTKNGDILFLAIEGRMLTSLGTDAEECVNILLRYNSYQALNMDGGTSAIMWYDGEYVIRCSNANLPEGRLLPNAWIYR